MIYGIVAFEAYSYISIDFFKNSQADDDRTIFLMKDRSRSPEPLILSVKSQKIQYKY